MIQQKFDSMLKKICNNNYKELEEPKNKLPNIDVSSHIDESAVPYLLPAFSLLHIYLYAAGGRFS